jgi:hypothetical protein
VPKIELFFDLRSPCSDQVVAQRNAQVLMPKSRVSQDTDFYKKLEAFRYERAEKKKIGINSIQLFIPGKIIHLADVKGDDGFASYTPYYAKRCEFNQVIMSNRMLADHDIHSLVDILRETQLCGESNRITVAFANSPITSKDDDIAELDVRLFMCCSNPYGKLPILLTTLAFGAFALTLLGHYGCEFFIYSYALDDVDGVVSYSYGLFKYKLLECAFPDEDGFCDSFGYEEADSPCVPSPGIYDDNLTAQAFAYVVKAFGFVSLTLLLVSQCFAIKRTTWMVITTLLALTSLFQGLVLLFLSGCGNAVVDVDTVQVTLNCQIARDS